MAVIKQNATRNRTFLMVSSGDHITGITGATVTVKISKNGGLGASPSGGATATEIDSVNMPGWYSIALSATDTNTLGDLDYHATATGADPMDDQDQVSVIDFSDGVRMGLLALPNAAAGVNGGLPIIGQQVPNANAGASSGLVINGTNSGATFTGGITGNLTGNVTGSVGSVTGAVGSVTSNVNINTSQPQADLVWQSTRYTQETGTAQVAGSGANSIQLRSGASSTTGLFVGCLAKIISGTGAGQSRVIISYDGGTKIAMVDQNWVVNPDGTSTYAIAMEDKPACNAQQAVVSSAVTGNVANVTGNVLGNVNGKVLGGGGQALVGVGVQSDCRSWNGTAVASPNTAGVPKVDVAEWVGGTPNNLISGLVPVNVQNTAGTLTFNLSGNMTGSVGSVTGAVGSVSGGVTVSTVNDKTGYSLASSEHTAIAGDVLNASAGNFNAAGSIGNKINSAASAGDPWTAILPGTYPAGSAGAIVGVRLDAQVSTRQGAGPVTIGGYASGQDPATLVLDVVATLHNTSGSIGAKISSAASAGDPWSTSLPGSYSAGQAGNIIGNRLDQAVSSRMPTFTLPANFSSLSVDSSGRITVSPNGLDPIVIESGVNFRQAMTICAAAMAGVLSGATGTNISIQGINNPTINRISAVVDANGDRTSVSLNLP